MSGSELSVECELRNRKNQAAYLLADNRPTKSRRGFLPFRNLQIHLNKLAQQVNLVMEYKKGVKSLDHVNLNIDHGIYGLLGENGAGKTTLMKILVTLLTPTSGTAEINGLTVEPKNFETIKKQIGYLPQEFGLYPNLTVRESLEYVGIMSGVQFMKSLQSKMFILWTERSATLPERW